MTIDLQTKLKIFEDFLGCAKVSLWHFDAEMELVSTTAENEELFLTLIAIGGFKQMAHSYCKSNYVPAFGADSASLLWLVAPLHANGALTDIYVIGPVFGSASCEQAILQSLKAMRLPWELLAKTTSLLYNVPIIQHTLLVQYAIMLHKCLTSYQLQPPDIQTLETRNHILSRLKKPEEPVAQARSYALEKQIFKAVEDGNINFVHPKEAYLITIGTLCRNNPLRHAKNEFVSCITLLTRAAIRGGLPEETAYALGDYYIQQGEDLSNVSDIYKCIKDAFVDFTQRVHKCKLGQGRSKEIQECISYLECHLTQNVTLSQLAENLGYNKNYLSGKFTKEVGMPITEYLMQAKIERAKIWLQNTDKSIQLISDDLGFNSLSYFSALFKKATSQSPKAFRSRKNLIE